MTPEPPASDDAALQALAERLGEAMRRTGARLTTAESCTGGWVAKCVTDVPGASQWFTRGYVVYSNAAKSELLGVAPGVLETFGAVSRQCAEQMAVGALHAAQAELAVAVTGIAGPDGGSPEKPVGLVWFALARAGGPPLSERHRFPGDREAVRRAAVAVALRLLLTPGM